MVKRVGCLFTRRFEPPISEISLEHLLCASSVLGTGAKVMNMEQTALMELTFY